MPAERFRAIGFSASSFGPGSTRSNKGNLEDIASGSSKDGCDAKVFSPNTPINNLEGGAKYVGKPNKFLQALELPTIANINPRSAYNKAEELKTFIKEEMVDVLFLSESWEREDLQLNEIIHLENHKVISNVFQRKGKGGRPALIVNTEKYHVQDITNTLVIIKWGVEAVWCLLTPKNVTKQSKVQKIACAAIYSKPGSKHR